MDKITIGQKDNFALEYCFYDENRETELAMYINGKNILEFEKNGKILTTKWNLDELVFWLRDFLNRNSEEPFPQALIKAFQSSSKCPSLSKLLFFEERK